MKRQSKSAKNLRKSGRRGPAGPTSSQAAADLWIYGTHAVLAALGNPKRRKHRLLISRESEQRHESLIRPLLDSPGAPLCQLARREDFLDVLPDSVVHQGMALACDPLSQPHLEDLFAAAADSQSTAVIVMLDQVTDPQNVGAIMRSAAAFGARALIVPGRNAAPESGVLVKTASGAFDHLPYVTVTNLARTLESLKAAGYWTLGLAGEAERALADARSSGPTVLVLGAEGGGLRRLTRETCDELVRLPTRGPIAALNVSNAAAVALYELLGREAGA